MHSVTVHVRIILFTHTRKHISMHYMPNKFQALF